jgi:ubiquinone/menaquinone biosynthesis C-methylase UbiE
MVNDDMATTTQTPSVTPMRIFEIFRAYQQTAALRAGIQLDIFTAIAAGNTTAADIANKTGASEKGIRILCDTIVTDGLLTKQDNHYGLAPDAALFLDRRSPVSMTSVSDFLAGEELFMGSLSLADAVRKGGTLMPGEGAVEPDNPFWVLFARSMAPLMSMAAHAIAEQVAGSGPLKVLDIAAGHGIFGIEIAKRNPQAQITALDWASVLEVAKENAEKAGVADRLHLLPGSAFDVEYGSDYDVILITNFLHHFDPETNERFLRRVYAALKPGGKAVTLEFCPNEDRISPLAPARFAITMLQSTPNGDAYTFRELDAMFKHAGFASSEQHLIPSEQSIVISRK